MAKRLKIGRLRDQVRFEHFTETDNSLGEPERNWVEYLTCRAEVLPVRTGEGIVQGQELATSEVTIRVRTSSQSRGITSAMRAVWGGQVLDLSPPRKVAGRDRYLEFTGLNRSTSDE
ncbi:phage head closure protein [Microbulbifer sp. HZ11]|uniref:phage head closure protein n=1 Tax=Microbulbifer sp. HZ11 TaxID=1453501 RepID=UPI0005BB2269|nr:phage head closure protein [Microbulbifer sp. HZ11]